MVLKGRRMIVMNLKLLERQLKSLANGNRLRLLAALRKKHSMTVGAAAAHLRISQAAASRHLQILEQAGVVVSRKRGLFVTYRLLLTGIPWTRAVIASLS